MSWIRLVLKSAFGDSHDPVKDSDFVVTSAADPKSPAQFQFEMICQLAFVPINIAVIPKAGEIIAVDNDCQVAVRKMEDAG